MIIARDNLRLSALFDERKAAEAAAFFLLRASARNASMTLLKLMKLMYLAERESYKRLGEPMIGDVLVSMPHGPVLSRTLNLINSTKDERDDGSAWDRLIAEREDRNMTLRPDSGVASEDDLLELSQSDIDILSDIWTEFGARSALDLRAYTHNPANIPEWQDPDGSSIPISLDVLLRALDFSADGIEATCARLAERASLASANKQDTRSAS
jgi:uncharacterized phage-associated protein